MTLKYDHIGSQYYCRGHFDIPTVSTDWSQWGNVYLCTKDLTNKNFSHTFNEIPDVVATANSSETGFITAIVLNVVPSKTGITQVTFVRGNATNGSVRLAYIASGV